MFCKLNPKPHFLRVNLSVIIFCLFVIAFSNFANAAIYADSVAEFSGVQGKNDWYYGYYNKPGDANSFTKMTVYNATNSRWSETPNQPPWTYIEKEVQHPNGTNSGSEHWSVRRWVSDISGPVMIQGLIGRQSTGNTIANIFINGVLRYSYGTLSLSKDGQHPYALLVEVSVGDNIDFSVGPNGVDFSDQTLFTAKILTVPESAHPVIGVSSINFTGVINVTCFNNSTKQKVTFKKKAGLLDCKTGGLIINDGDNVTVTSTGVTVPFAHHRYETIADCGSWFACKASAESLGGYLATIGSKAEQDFLYSQLRIKYKGLDTLWIGLADYLNEGTFVWEKGEPLNFKNWASGQPDNKGGAQDCAGILISGNGKWDDLNCDSSYSAIVEYD